MRRGLGDDSWEEEVIKKRKKGGVSVITTRCECLSEDSELTLCVFQGFVAVDDVGPL